MDWPTIKPWLTKILDGEIDIARKMTCAELGGPTKPGKSRERNLRSNNNNIADAPWAHRKMISNGNVVTADKYPFMVSFGTFTTHSGPQWEAGCDGTLVAPDIVLAAAHCFEYDEFTSGGIWPGTRSNILDLLRFNLVV